MWHNRHSKNQRMLCFDCSRPRCTAQQCKACPVCRDPECKKRKCANKIVPLHPKLLPKDAEEVRSYLCQMCQYITCKCGNRMSQTMQRKTKAQPTKKEYVCVDCQSKELQAKDHSHKVSRFHWLPEALCQRASPRICSNGMVHSSGNGPARGFVPTATQITSLSSWLRFWLGCSKITSGSVVRVRMFTHTSDIRNDVPQGRVSMYQLQFWTFFNISGRKVGSADGT